MIDASEAYKRTSEVNDLMAQKEFEKFIKEADKCITSAIDSGYWSCYILCDPKARTLACRWLENHGYQVRFGFEGVFVCWDECE